jgi:hypothetical protein
LKKEQPLTHNIPKKGFIGMRSSSPAIGCHRLDSGSYRNPLLAIPPTLWSIIKKHTMIEYFSKSKMILQIILIFALLIISCNRNNDKNKIFIINGVQFELPNDYNLQVIDSIRKEWILTKKKENILIINSGGDLDYRPNNLLNSQYFIMSDTISGYRREILYSKKKDCY